ncbi:hypothetical protein VTK26DRAFT_288 [Humicola hyalothermophila]
MAAARKKSRSKSMGPGGFDSLKAGNGNRRASLAVFSGPPPRSILKPTIPIVQEIPSYRPKQTGGSSNVGAGSEGTKVALRTEEEQQAAAREREERERAELEKEINDRREARRKSLANRRVSFAAEATLHTFHEIEEMQDSTTSTDSTRRASQHHEPSSDPPSTPPGYGQDHHDESPALHQRNRRRSSGATSICSEDETVSSSVYDSDLEHADGVAEIQHEEASSGDSSSEDGSVVTVEAEEMTSASVATMASAHSAVSSDSSGSLDENLRLAARMAVTQSINDDEEEVIAGFAGWGKKNRSQEKASQAARNEDNGQENNANGENQGSDMEMDGTEMDMTHAVGGILRPQPQPASPEKDENEDEDQDMSMDVTTALGGILSKAKAFLRRKSVNPASQPEQEELGEQTMDLTTAVGGIQQGQQNYEFDDTQAEIDGNEDMSMEFTAVMGKLLPGAFPAGGSQDNRRRTMMDIENDGDDGETMMDMTVAAGRILPTTEAQQEEDGDQTMGMDMTTAVGGIIKPASTPEARSAARRVMEQEADEPAPSMTAALNPTGSPKRPAAAGMENSTGSSELAAFQGTGLRRTPPRAVSPVARSPAQSSSSPVRHTPSPKRSAAQAQRSPTRTPPSRASSRSSSPMRLTSSPIKTTPRSPARPKLFHQDPHTGLSTPRVVLTPQGGRRLSGVGADRSGLGSPRVAEIFDRRTSIGEAATGFVPSQPDNPRRAVAFTDPRVIEAEMDDEGQDEHGKDEGERETATNLMEMIQGLSPKKKPLRGRKSLHVGSARGLLGKRPVELDDDDEESEDAMDGVKRLKGHQGSPVKNIRLNSPPSKAETTTGRKTRPSINPSASGDRATPTMGSSPQRATTTPRSPGRLGDEGDGQPGIVGPMGEGAEMRQDDGNEERIHLQDFLNMTSIRFMELTTTKRRHTVAPGERGNGTAADGQDDLSLERCVVAGACTVPMLELYQHSCHELKKYISEGRRIVREIESETFEENPPLFREYMTASPEFKVLMDNQFKNVKTHARLLSKAMWYEWRMKLQDGLQEGLVKTAEGMDKDDKLLAKQQELLSSVLPDMVKRLEALELERENLEAVARELADCDPQDLEDARAELAAVDASIAEKAKKVADLERDLQESVGGIEALTIQKQQCLEEIKEADRIREECRGWSSAEISKLKAQTEVIEKKHGWAIAGISGTAISMRYKREIELTFDIAAFQNQRKQPRASSSSSPHKIDLRYIPPPPHLSPVGAAQQPTSSSPSPEKHFFLRRIRRHLFEEVTKKDKMNDPRRLLAVVAAAWDRARAVAEEVRRLRLSFPTAVAVVGAGAGAGGRDRDMDREEEEEEEEEESLVVTASVLLVPLQTRVEVVIRVAVGSRSGGEKDARDRGDGGDGDRDGLLEVSVCPEAKVVYGEGFNAAKMGEFLRARIGEGGMGWDEAVLGLGRKLLGEKGAKG